MQRPPPADRRKDSGPGVPRWIRRPPRSGRDRAQHAGVFSLLALGAGSTATQIVIVREILGGFGGSEMLAVAALGLWLLATGAGSLIAGLRFDRKERAFLTAPTLAAAADGAAGLAATAESAAATAAAATASASTRGMAPRAGTASMIAGHVALALFPFGMMVALRALPGWLDARGSLPALLPSVLGCLLVVLPYGLAGGAMIPSAARRAATKRARESRAAYLLDGAGCAVGGAVLCLLLLLQVPHGWALFAFALPHAVAAAVLVAGSPPKRISTEDAARGSARSTTPATARLTPSTARSTTPSAARPATSSAVRPAARSPRSGPALTLFALLIAASVSGALLLDPRSLRLRFPGQQIAAFIQTPYGQLAVTRTGGQINVLQNGLPWHSSGDHDVESRVHPALCQVPAGAAVLVVGGAIPGAPREAARHRPSRLDVVEIDPAVFDLARALENEDHDEASTPAPDAGGRTLDPVAARSTVADGRAWIRGHRLCYDAILLDLPGPENIGLNRYYTAEFFREARAALRPGGVVAFSLASSGNYQGPEQRAVERSVAAAMRESFPVVEVLPGDRHLFFAGDCAIDLDLEPVLTARGIVPRRLLDYDWPDHVDPFRHDELRRRLGLDSSGPLDVTAREANRDLSPRAFRHRLELRARIGEVHRVAPLLFILVPLLVFAAATGRRADRFSVGTSGFAAMSLQFGLLLVFQVLCGSLYLGIAFFVTLFLAGCSIGAAIAPRLPGTGRARLGLADAVLVTAALLMMAAGRVSIQHSSPGRDLIAYGLLPLVTLASAVAVGVQFAVAGEVGPRPEPSRTARLYLVDLAGAASGTILGGLWLLPRHGLDGLAAGVVAAKLASLGILAIRRRRT